MTNVIEIKNILVERLEAHLRLPRKPLFIFHEAHLGRSIGTAQIKKRDGLYLADLTFSPIIEAKRIPVDEYFPTLIIQGNNILGIALGIYPNVDAGIKRLSMQLQGSIRTKVFTPYKLINGKPHESAKIN